jgi:hypothetical protein
MVRDPLNRLKRNYPLIMGLKNGSPGDRKLILKKANSDFIKCLADICENIVNGHIILPERQKQCLSKHKKIIRKMANKKIGIRKKRKALIQKGGFLAGILPAVSIAASIIAGLLGK